LQARATSWGAYRGIADSLRARIVSGEYAPGSPLPSEADLCAEYRVARNTLRRSLAQLAAEGVIAVRPGLGRVVATRGQRPEPTVPRYRSVAVELRALIESGELPPGAPVPSESALAARYGIARGTARHALAELEGAGLVEAVHGRGRFVRRR
jgi:DNA-binding GntR family transcriptional regulator